MAHLIAVGDVYEDCGYHLVLCLHADDGEISGISLIDGSYPHNCDEIHCGVRKVPIGEVMGIRSEYARWRARRMEEDGVDS